jgi:hypothetical protein
MSNGFGNSFSIMVPPGYGIGMFRRLVYSGCKPIGHKEYLSIKLECGQPVFPDDYHHSEVGNLEACKVARLKLETYCKRPPSKRPNYQKTKSYNPFRPNINVSTDYAFFSVSSFQRGVPKDGASLFIPSFEDLQTLLSKSRSKVKSNPALFME